jgi:hypothetical protein
MPCHPFRTGDLSGVLCTRGRPALAPRCSQARQNPPKWLGRGGRLEAGPGSCPFPAVALCDYPLGKGRTCGAKICGDHRTKIGDSDHCPAHAGALMLPGIL